MSTTDKFQQLLEACKRNDPAATAEFVQRYLPLIRIAVRRRLDVAMRGRFDSLDFTQDVWYSFFRCALDRKDFESEKDLVAYLCQMGRLKVLEEHRHQTTAKVGLLRTQISCNLNEEPSPDPSPSTIAIGNDEWDNITASLPQRHREMLNMLREGHSQTAAAEAFGVSLKTLQRLLRRLVDRQLPPESHS